MHLESTHIDQTGIYYCNSADANQSNNEGKEMSSSLYLLVYGKYLIDTLQRKK